MTEAEKGWVAGIIDGEGCICAFMRSDTKGITGHLTVHMTHKPTVLRLKELTNEGRSYLAEHKRATNRKPIWSWKVSQIAASRVLRELLPYLFIKRKEAEIFITIFEMHDGRHTRVDSRPNHTTRISLVQALKAEKHVAFAE